MIFLLLIFLCIFAVVDAIKQLDGEVSTIVSQAWADNTLKTRNSQWSKYFQFCIDYGFCALPAEPSTVVRFLVFLSRHCKYSTINNYLSAVNTLHKFYGHDIDFRQYYIIKLVSEFYLVLVFCFMTKKRETLYIIFLDFII